jgi:hypothetical protein
VGSRAHPCGSGFSMRSIGTWRSCSVRFDGDDQCRRVETVEHGMAMLGQAYGPRPDVIL